MIGLQKREGKRLVNRSVTLAEEPYTSQLETMIIQNESTNKQLHNCQIDKLNNEVNQPKKENKKLKSILQEATIKHGCDVRVRKYNRKDAGKQKSRRYDKMTKLKIYLQNNLHNLILS
ncbi:hypothetical protein NQ317_015313 [Molorchus minor]|uniref:Uncharacterized protein n=1 Tax=Molorchus minor TaxID=1323400 RepID=A0ABQ9JC75_9CUCU|nr:hypothetical protein NQ317_015313 [Molorchus minor]